VLLPELFSADLDTIADEIQVVELAKYTNMVLLPYPRNSVFRFRNRSASILPSKQDASPRRGRN
jgi:hypothetical protein